MGRDLIQIQQQLGKAAATTFRDNTQEFERDNVTTWDIGTLPESIKFARGKQQLTGYLGLQKEKDGRIALRLFDTSAAAEQAHRLGVIELMKLQLKEQVKDLNKGIQGFTQAAMLLKHINADTLRDDLTQAVCDRAFIGEDELPRNEKAFKEQIKRARSRLPAVKEALSRYLQETAAAYAELNGKLGKHPLTHLLRQRLQTLLAAGFATSGSTEGRGTPREYEYPNLVEASADAKTCEAALRRVRPELHEHELWAFRIVLDEARASIARAKNLPPRR